MRRVRCPRSTARIRRAIVVLALATVGATAGTAPALTATAYGAPVPTPPPQQAAVERPGEGWRAHTPMRRMRDVAVGDGAIWGGTSGGLFRFDLKGGHVARFTTVEGLSQIDVQAVAFDPSRSHVWIGYSDGTLDRLDVESGAVESLGEIERARRYSDRAILSLTVRTDSLLVGTGFGLVVVDLGELRVRDSYVRFGEEGVLGVADVAVGSVTSVADGKARYWLATSEGVAHAPVDHPNLRDPTAWTVEPISGAGGPLYAVAVHEGKIYAGAPTGGFVRANGDSGSYERAWTTRNGLRDLVVTEQGLVGVFRFVLRRLGSENRLVLPDRDDLRALVVGPDGDYWVADGESGVAGFDELPTSGEIGVDREIFPEGPYHGLFSDLEVDPKGRLWAGGSPAPGTGFYRLSEDGWTNYTRGFVPALGERDGFDVIEVGPDESVWAGSRGDGLARLAPDGSVTVFDAENSALRPASGTEDYVRIGGLAAESDGTLWATNMFASPSLVVRDVAGEWHSLPHLQEGPVLSSARFAEILVDRAGRKWMGLRRLQNADEGRGLVVFDDGGTPADPGDDRTRVVQEGPFNEGLPENTVTALAEDERGRLWVGTRRGLAYFPSPGAVLTGGPAAAPQWPVREGSLFLDELSIADIAVDPAGRKWLATSQGAWLVDAAGTELVSHLTRENSPLFSDNVVAVSVDPATGRVYFATDAGLLSMRGTATRPAEEAGELTVYPNPVPSNLLGTRDVVTIEGLTTDAQVRIVTPSGRLIHRFDAGSGRIQWDGTDRSGRPVSPGVYLVVATGEGAGSSFGKIAVVE